MSAEIDYAAEMELPPGKTCSDCVHFRRCSVMFGHTATDRSCDWHPSRFHPATTVSTEETAHDDV